MDGLGAAAQMLAVRVPPFLASGESSPMFGLLTLVLVAVAYLGAGVSGLDIVFGTIIPYAAIALFLGWAFAGEPITASTLAGAGLILTGVLLVVHRRPG